MNTKLALTGALAAAVLAASTAVAAAESAKETAIRKGMRLSSEQIAERLVGKTVTFVAGKKKFLFHYSENNVISGKLIGGDWSDTGYYGITDEDSVCLSLNSKDKGRLRCLTVFVVDGVVKKFTAQGKLSGDLVSFQDGKMF